MGLSPDDFKLSFATTNDTAAASHAEASERSGEAVPTLFESASDAGDPGSASAETTTAALLMLKAILQLPDRESRRTPKQISSGVHGYQKSGGEGVKQAQGPACFPRLFWLGFPGRSGLPCKLPFLLRFPR